jgi:ribonuclease HI
MAKKNYYVVKSGRKTGIFKTWAECNAQIKGFSGAVYKGFEALAEAEAYFSGEPIASPVSDDGADYPIAYVDGSFDKRHGIYAFGAAIIQPGGDVVELSGTGKNAEAAAEWNIAGELMGAMTAVKWAYQNGFPKILIKHDYEGIARWARGEWKANKYCATQYVAFLAKFRGKVEFLFEKVPAHSGVYYNEIVDQLAKKAIADEIEKGETDARNE